VLQVSLDHSDQQVEQDFPLIGLKRRKNAVRDVFCDGGIESFKQPFSFRQEKQEACSPVVAIHAAFDETHSLELVNEHARIVAIDAETSCEAVLVDARIAASFAQIWQRSELQWSETGRAVCIRRD
jgi:hypothetical protein